jgi:hypothetical protein
MKTLTELQPARLKLVADKRTELTTAGKTAEELPAALAEATQIEAEKLVHFTNANELLAGRTQGLKRVVALQLTEGEKAPKDSRPFGEFHYVIEYFPSAPQRPVREERDSRGGGRDGKRGGKRDGKRGDRGNGRGPRPVRENSGSLQGEATLGGAPAQTDSAQTPGAGDRPARPPRQRRPRTPRAERPAPTAESLALNPVPTGDPTPPEKRIPFRATPLVVSAGAETSSQKGESSQPAPEAN